MKRPMKHLLLFLTTLTLSGTEICAADTWLAVGYGGRRMISNDGFNWEITAE